MQSALTVLVIGTAMLYSGFLTALLAEGLVNLWYSLDTIPPSWEIRESIDTVCSPDWMVVEPVNHSIRELKQLAKARHIKGYGNLSKAQLVVALGG